MEYVKRFYTLSEVFNMNLKSEDFIVWFATEKSILNNVAFIQRDRQWNIFAFYKLWFSTLRTIECISTHNRHAVIVKQNLFMCKCFIPNVFPLLRLMSQFVTLFSYASPSSTLLSLWVKRSFEQASSMFMLISPPKKWISCTPIIFYSYITIPFVMWSIKSREQG